MLINGMEIMWNMEYIFKDTDIKLNAQQMKQLEASYSRALHLEKHNGASVMCLTKEAADWLRYAYENNLPVNQKAYEDCVRRLKGVSIPNQYL